MTAVVFCPRTWHFVISRLPECFHKLQRKLQNLTTMINCLKTEGIRFSTYLNGLWIFPNHLSIHFFASSSGGGRFRKLDVTYAAVFLRVLVFDNPDILDAPKLLECTFHVVRRVLLTTDYKYTRKRRVVDIYTTRNRACFHALLTAPSHF